MKTIILFIAVTILYSANHKTVKITDQPIRQLQLSLDTTQHKLDNLLNLVK